MLNSYRAEVSQQVLKNLNEQKHAKNYLKPTANYGQTS